MGDYVNYFDLHCDTASEIYNKKTDFFEGSLAVNFNKIPFDEWCQTFAFFIKDDRENPFSLYKNMLSYFTDKMKISLQPFEYILAVEGGAVLQEDCDRLYILKNDRIKFLSLAWNGETALAGGAYSEKGLTKLGEKAVALMNKLKIACDLSHLNEKSFYKAVELSSYPLATHSNCYNICCHKRNLKEEQIKAVSEKKGIIGLCFYPQFLGCDVLEGIYKNIFYLLDKGYEDIIAIGSDFDGGEMDKKLDNIAKVPILYRYLEDKGIENRLLSKIFYENAEKFVAKL